MQYLIALIGFWLVLMYPAHAGPPVPDQFHTEIPRERAPLPAAAMGQQIPPLASFGVMQCGEIVAIWVVLQDHSVLRTDAEHHPETPEETNAFLQWLKTAQSDIYAIPCPDKQ